MLSRKKVQELYFYWLNYFIIALISMAIGTGFFLSSFYIHEGGHILFGYLYNAWVGNYNVPYISNWTDFYGIPLPQQTNNEKGVTTCWFGLGGIYLMLTTIFLITFILSKKLVKVSKILIYSIFLVFFVKEIVGNFILGTDNPFGGIENPTIKNSLEYLPFLLMIVFFFILANYYSKFDKITKKIVRTRHNPKTLRL